MREQIVALYDVCSRAVRFYQDIMKFVEFDEFNILLWFQYTLQNTLEIVVESRKQLMLTYIFAYYAKQHSQKDAFESLDCKQDCLDGATKSLSNRLEQILRNRIAVSKGTLLMDIIAMRIE